jgi:hypothetical protein
VYYGPALSGKTTNLQVLHRMFDPQHRGRLMSLETQTDLDLFLTSFLSSTRPREAGLTRPTDSRLSNQKLCFRR